MFVDELEIHVFAGNGGDGVVRWRREKFRPKAGPAGGNGGRGGDVYVRAVGDRNRLAQYVSNPTFKAQHGEPGRKLSQDGKGGEDLVVELPVGSVLTDVERRRTLTLESVGETVKILSGGSGGHGNEHFKSSTNQAPGQAVPGQRGECARLQVEVRLIAEVGLVGLPNAGKSTLLNSLTAATSKVGAYPFTTTEPHLGALEEFLIADIPGLIAGASTGKGLGHRFLRHVTRTKMLLHLVSLDSDDPVTDYYTILDELKAYDESLLQRDRWLLLTKKDLTNQSDIARIVQKLEKSENRVFVLDQNDSVSIKDLRDSLVSHLRAAYNTTAVTPE